MGKKSLLILSYSNLQSDPRILRQIHALKGEFNITTAGNSSVNDSTIIFFPIYTLPVFSLKRKLKRFFQFIIRRFEQYYWDSGKENIRNQLSKHHYDVIIANDIHTLPLALAIANNKGKVYFDAHEYHPREFEENLRWRLFYKPFIEYLCKTYIPKANAFSTVAESIADEYQKYIGFKPFVITNAAYFCNLQPSKVTETEIKLIHHGAAIQGRQIENMIDVMRKLDHKYSLFLMLTGKGSHYYNQLINYAAKQTNIFFVDPVPFNEIIKNINQYDIGLYNLPPVNFNNQFALPNKLFEFVQARLGIVVTPNPEMANLVRNYKLGVVSEDYTPESMAKIISKLDYQLISKFKDNSNLAAKALSAEENLKKINKIVSDLVR